MVGRAEGRSGLLSEATADLAIPLRKAAGSPASKLAKGCPQPPKGLPAPSRETKGRLGWAEVGQTVPTQRATCR